VFRSYYGPVVKAFAVTDPETLVVFEADLHDLLDNSTSPKTERWSSRANILKWLLPKAVEPARIGRRARGAPLRGLREVTMRISVIARLASIAILTTGMLAAHRNRSPSARDAARVVQRLEDRVVNRRSGRSAGNDLLQRHSRR
jgi:hypothetical protein